VIIYAFIYYTLKSLKVFLFYNLGSINESEIEQQSSSNTDIYYEGKNIVHLS
jgi:hypothetical protein